MREIKFRAFGKNSKEFLQDQQGYGLTLKEIQNIEAIDLWEFSQFTGLKDKNGKEIYEGDICKAPHDFGPAGWSERTFTVHFDINCGYQWSYWALEKLEIIGNIYENPELLNSQPTK